MFIFTKNIHAKITTWKTDWLEILLEVSQLLRKIRALATEEVLVHCEPFNDINGGLRDKTKIYSF